MSDAQIQKGREAVQVFHNASLSYPNYKLSFDALLNQVSKGHPTVFLGGLGLAIDNINQGSWFNFVNVDKAMKNLAEQGKGRVPSDMNVFFTALSDDAQNINWVDAIGFTSVESAKKVGEGLQEVGDITLDTLKSFGAVLPLALLLGAGFIFYSRVRQVAGR